MGPPASPHSSPTRVQCSWAPGAATSRRDCSKCVLVVEQLRLAVHVRKRPTSHLEARVHSPPAHPGLAGSRLLLSLPLPLPLPMPSCSWTCTVVALRCEPLLSSGTLRFHLLWVWRRPPPAGSAWLAQLAPPQHRGAGGSLPSWLAASRVARARVRQCVSEKLSLSETPLGTVNMTTEHDATRTQRTP